MFVILIFYNTYGFFVNLDCLVILDIFSCHA